MADELSPECKQKLRELDHSLGSAHAMLADTSRQSGPVSPQAMHSVAKLTEDLRHSFAQLDQLDDPCRRLLRNLDHTSNAISRLGAAPHALFADKHAISDQLALVERAIAELRPYLDL